MKKITSPIKEVKNNGKTIVHDDGSVCVFKRGKGCLDCAYDYHSLNCARVHCGGGCFTSSHQPQLIIKFTYINTDNIEQTIEVEVKKVSDLQFYRELEKQNIIKIIKE